jgi:CHAT domain-containing protein
VSNQDRFDEADRLFRRAEPLIERSAHPDHRARLLVYRAFHAEQQGQYRSALDMVRASVRLRRQGETGKDALAHSLFEAARLLLKLEDPGQAREMARDALDNYQAAYGSTHWWVAATHDLLADIEKLLGDYRKARSHNGKAVAIRRVLFGPSAPLAQSYAQLAGILTAEGRRADALAAYRRMADILLANRDARDGVGPAPITAYILAALRQAGAVADPRRRAGLRAEAFVASQLARGGAAAQAIDLMAARLASGSVEIAGKIKSLQDARERLDGLRRALAAEMSKPTKLRHPEPEDRLKREIKKQAEAIQAIDAALEAAHPRYYRLIAPRPLDPAAVNALLRPDEALVSFFVGEDVTVVFLVGDGAVRANAVDLSRQDLTTVVTELRAGVDWGQDYGADFDTRLSQKLHQILLGGFAAELAGVAHLIFVPAGPLMSLPPAVLVTEPIKGDPTDYGSVSWLVRNHAVSVLPSVHALKAMRTQTTGSRASRPFIGFGAPNFTGRPEDDSARRALEQGCLEEPEGADRSMVRSLPRLPETSAELRTIAASLGASEEAVVLGDAASEATVREVGLRDYRVVAFATHGLLPENLNCNMEPALALTPSDTGGNESDGLLMASEIAALELDAEVALLSACDTAGPGGLGGESLSGLARAFIYAGARRVVASHWAVFSVPTVRLTTGIFERLAGAPKDGYAAALRRSQLALLNDPDMVHPVIWAPFVLIGDGGASR